MKLQSYGLLLGTLLLAMFIVRFAAVTQFSELLDRDVGRLTEAAESIRLAQSLKSRLLTHNRNSFLYTLNRNPQLQESTVLLTSEVTQRLTGLRERSGDEAEITLIDTVETEFADYFNARNALFEGPLAPTEQYEQMTPYVDRTVSYIDRLIELNRVQLSSLNDSIVAQNAISQRLAVGLIFAGGLVLLGALISVILFIAWPLARLAGDIAKYGENQRPFKTEVKGIREIRDIAESFNSMADRLEVKRQEQLRIVAIIAHDLRNPLHSVAMAIESMRLNSASESSALLEMVAHQIAQMDRLLSDFLDTSRIEAGEFSMEFSNQDIRLLLKEAMALFENTEDSRHEFVAALADQPMMCHCDPRRLTQAITNLLSNAVKYSPQGGEISVSAQRQGDWLEITVSDQGIGVDPEDRENIFQPFHRSPASKGVYPGIGLGLSSTRRIVEAHGGRIQLETPAAKGSTFRLILPVARSADSEEASHLNGSLNLRA
ncbi:MAG: HAMP domain-containing sensor histidine kinase [Pseudohongiellaceae bacterium]